MISQIKPVLEEQEKSIWLIFFLSEVKIDLMSEKTGNIFFEQSYRGEPSGFEATESHLWFEVIPNEGVFAFSTKHLKERIRRDYHTHGTQRPHCGDGGMSSGLTFKKEWVKELFWCIAEPDGVSVSYTHLTLPTKA